VGLLAEGARAAGAAALREALARLEGAGEAEGVPAAYRVELAEGAAPACAPACQAAGCGYGAAAAERVTRSHAGEDAHRDFDGWDIDEELARLRVALQAVKGWNIRFAEHLAFVLEAIENIDEHLTRSGGRGLPKAWSWNLVGPALDAPAPIDGPPLDLPDFEEVGPAEGDGFRGMFSFLNDAGRRGLKAALERFDAGLEPDPETPIGDWHLVTSLSFEEREELRRELGMVSGPVTIFDAGEAAEEQLG
jgi:hypothetical protein